MKISGCRDKNVHRKNDESRVLLGVGGGGWEYSLGRYVPFDGAFFFQPRWAWGGERLMIELCFSAKTLFHLERCPLKFGAAFDGRGLPRCCLALHVVFKTQRVDRDASGAGVRLQHGCQEACSTGRTLRDGRQRNGTNRTGRTDGDDGGGGDDDDDDDDDDDGDDDDDDDDDDGGGGDDDDGDNGGGDDDGEGGDDDDDGGGDDDDGNDDDDEDGDDDQDDDDDDDNGVNDDDDDEKIPKHLYVYFLGVSQYKPLYAA